MNADLTGSVPTRIRTLVTNQTSVSATEPSSTPWVCATTHSSTKKIATMMPQTGTMPTVEMKVKTAFQPEGMDRAIPMFQKSLPFNKFHKNLWQTKPILSL